MLGLPSDCPFHVHECPSCRYRFLHPYLSIEELRDLYGSHYFTGETDGDRRDGTVGSSVDYNALAEERIPKFRASLDLIQQHAPGARTILDVGAATGDLLALAKERGLEPAGVELSAHAAAVAKARHGLDLFVGRLEDFPVTHSFDVIHLNHVLEHFVDPREAVRRLEALLAPTGVVYIEVPYQFNWGERVKHRLARTRPPFTVWSIHHPVFFTPSTVVRLFERVGLRPRTLRVFDRARYPAATPVQIAKRLAWQALSQVGEGTFIEAVFARTEA